MDSVLFSAANSFTGLPVFALYAALVIDTHPNKGSNKYQYSGNIFYTRLGSFI
jgi:hypothetical protein